MPPAVNYAGVNSLRQRRYRPCCLKSCQALVAVVSPLLVLIGATLALGTLCSHGLGDPQFVPAQPRNCSIAQYSTHTHVAHTRIDHISTMGVLFHTLSRPCLGQLLIQCCSCFVHDAFSDAFCIHHTLDTAIDAMYNHSVSLLYVLEPLRCMLDVAFLFDFSTLPCTFWAQHCLEVFMVYMSTTVCS